MKRYGRVKSGGGQASEGDERRPSSLSGIDRFVRKLSHHRFLLSEDESDMASNSLWNRSRPLSQHLALEEADRCQSRLRRHFFLTRREQLGEIRSQTWIHFDSDVPERLVMNHKRRGYWFPVCTSRSYQADDSRRLTPAAGRLELERTRSSAALPVVKGAECAVLPLSNYDVDPTRHLLI
ncbi:unnamed protein product [Pleuronectes platessa]|uniref:Uncharacterized protein n=1 Tax=Pleuronectes platessa TaxID=8262 RepID=A0A9N7UVL4_PLEPL|nr:unnamed protein product [Pleuronectes platessa]